MNINDPLTLVIFGATGNLYVDKLAKALYLLFLEEKLPLRFTIIAFGRRDMTNKSFRNFTKESILKRGKIDVSKLDSFLEHIEYFKGDFSNKEDFIKLKSCILRFNLNGQILFHIATASNLYRKIFENIKDAELNKVTDKSSILIEKPFGKNESDAKKLQKILTGIFKEKNIFHVDHYLAKETARSFFDSRWANVQEKNEWNNETVEKIKVIFNESNLVGSRGASYDAVGAFSDVGQNHLLQLLALTIMDKPAKFDAKHIRFNRAKALSSLYIDKNKKITKGQYEGYLSEPDVEQNSKTETFFRVFVRSSDPNLSDISFELEGGKGLVDMRSTITPTTVTIEIYFKNGKKSKKKEFKIQPVPGTVYESYIKVYEDALKGDQTFFVSIEEIILEWKLTDELLKKWKNMPLVIYKIGSKAEQIK